jgi:uncharacterized protein YbcC (UPF0753/DUF2309 family)
MPVDVGQRISVHADVALAAKALSPNWPLERFIAVNPLGGFEGLPFEEAVSEGERWFGARGTPPEHVMRAAYEDGRITHEALAAALAELWPQLVAGAPIELAGRTLPPTDLLICDMLHGTPREPASRQVRTLSEQWDTGTAELIDELSARWCAAYLDDHQAAWSMPGRERGFYSAWRDLAHHDRALPRPARKQLRELPERADEALAEALEQLEITAADRREYLQAHLTALPGFSSHVRWRSEHEPGFSLLDLLAMRLCYEAVLLADDPRARGLADPAPVPAEENPAARASRVASILSAGQVKAEEQAQVQQLLAQLPVARREHVWLAAYEACYRDPLLAALSGNAPASAQGRPEAQLVCCIDARSEGLRRHLEALGNYETLGFAGFFAVAISYNALAESSADALCPVLLEPRNPIHERPTTGAADAADRHVRARKQLAAAEGAFHTAKDDMAAPFVLAEAGGWVAGPLAAYKTLAAGRYGVTREKLRQRAVPAVDTELSIESGFTAEERGMFAEVALTMMGLTSGFAPLVVLCGHGSTTENNPYAAALDCGACGGQRGGPNARTAAAILNDPNVRAHLRTRGIEIPDDTWFAAAEHDTAHDQVQLLDLHLMPAAAATAAAALAPDLDEAGHRLSAERLATLPGAPAAPTEATSRRHARARSSDWAQVFPEWGLAGNAAFIVGPRSMTKGVDLGRRCFLHSYEAAVDTEGAALETILTAPLVVAQWINCQYYFSTVAPDVFGSGTKTIHNVVAGIGVLSGQSGDLRLGLPWQSVAVGDKLIHEPMRLLAAVQAPLDRIDTIVGRNSILQKLFGNGWVALAAREHGADPWMRHTADGWKHWNNNDKETAA